MQQEKNDDKIQQELVHFISKLILIIIVLVISLIAMPVYFIIPNSLVSQKIKPPLLMQPALKQKKTQ